MGFLWLMIKTVIKNINLNEDKARGILKASAPEGVSTPEYGSILSAPMADFNCYFLL